MEGGIAKLGDGTIQFCQDICTSGHPVNYNHWTQLVGLSLPVKFLLDPGVVDENKRPFNEVMIMDGRGKFGNKLSS